MLYPKLGIDADWRFCIVDIIWPGFVPSDMKIAAFSSPIEASDYTSFTRIYLQIGGC